MKKLIIGISALVVAICLGLFSFLNLENICENAIGQGETILLSLKEKEDEKSSTEIERFQAFYQKKRVYLGVYLNQEEFEELDLLFYAIDSFEKKEKTEDLIECTQEIIHNFKHIKQSEIPNFENIF